MLYTAMIKQCPARQSHQLQAVCPVGPAARERCRAHIHAHRAAGVHVSSEAAAGGLPGEHGGAELRELQELAAMGDSYAILALGQHLVHGQHMEPNHDQVCACCACGGRVPLSDHLVQHSCCHCLLACLSDITMGPGNQASSRLSLLPGSAVTGLCVIGITLV